MAVPPDSETDTFHIYFDQWLVVQNRYLQDLISFSRQHNQTTHTDQSSTTLTPPLDDEPTLIDRVIQHYEQYYLAKSRYAKQDVLAMFSPSWRSSLEDAFLWVGGRRPTMAFHLLYSKSGLQLEERLADLIRGFSTGDLGDLSPSQMSKVDELQRRTVREEKEITEKMAKHQETVADSSMVELSHMVTELMMSESDDGGVDEERIESTLASKNEGLEEILELADDLRLRTLKAIVDLFTSI